ncbi:MAG TPA: 4'-phosphopantetheinyl transferase superfamily protein, partial [Kiloniellales bacterium]|nr:4'-phosphopantetheinyl transferase superfamily protein [Kiloniellales bacterium]
LLAGILKRPPAAIPIGVTEPDGKPRVESHALAGRPLDFSLSHSGRQALVGIAIGTGHIGVDLEARGVPADFRALAQRNFTAEEQRWLFAAPAATQGLRFLQCWTRKEAYLKAIGKGFSRNPSLFRCRIDSDGAVVGLAHDAGGRPQARWQTLPLDESDVAACAVVDFDAAAIRIERFDWKSAAQD